MRREPKRRRHRPADRRADIVGERLGLHSRHSGAAKLARARLNDLSADAVAERVAE
jgi:hypothetical protein